MIEFYLAHIWLLVPVVFVLLIVSFTVARETGNRYWWTVFAVCLIAASLVWGMAYWIVRDVPRAPDPPINQWTELETNILTLRLYLLFAVATVFSGTLIMFGCLWKMAYLLWRYYRWSTTARRAQATAGKAKPLLEKRSTQSAPL